MIRPEMRRRRNGAFLKTKLRSLVIVTLNFSVLRKLPGKLSCRMFDLKSWSLMERFGKRLGLGRN